MVELISGSHKTVSGCSGTDVQQSVSESADNPNSPSKDHEHEADHTEAVVDLETDTTRLHETQENARDIQSCWECQTSSRSTVSSP